MPLECHIQGFPGKFYCPRMATMNKPAYAAIQLHSPIKPVLVFVSSRRQTRLTALDLIAFAAAADRPRQFLHVAEHELAQMLARVHVSFFIIVFTLLFYCYFSHCSLEVHPHGILRLSVGVWAKGDLQVRHFALFLVSQHGPALHVEGIVWG